MRTPKFKTRMSETKKRPKQSREQVETRLALAAAVNRAKVEARCEKVAAYLQAHGPASVAGIATALHMSESSARDTVRRLKGGHATDTRERSIRVAKWEPNPGREVDFPAPMYAPGTGRDAKRPKKSNSTAGKEYRRHYLGLVRARNRARLGIATIWDQLLYIA